MVKTCKNNNTRNLSSVWKRSVVIDDQISWLCYSLDLDHKSVEDFQSTAHRSRENAVEEREITGLGIFIPRWASFKSDRRSGHLIGPRSLYELDSVGHPKFQNFTPKTLRSTTLDPRRTGWEITIKGSTKFSKALCPNKRRLLEKSWKIYGSWERGEVADTIIIDHNCI